MNRRNFLAVAAWLLGLSAVGATPLPEEYRPKRPVKRRAYMVYVDDQGNGDETARVIAKAVADAKASGAMVTVHEVVPDSWLKI